MTECPFRITIYNRAFQRRGWIGDPLSVRATPRHNAIGSAVITLPSNHRRLPDLAAPGARIVLEFKGSHLMSGPVRLRSGKGPRMAGQVTVEMEDDLRLFWRVLGWPVPTAALTAQTSAYDTRTGPAETVSKAFVQANAITRLGLPVTVAPSQGRGSSITVAMRMHPLADRLFPAVDAAGIGLTVRQSGASLVVDAYTPRVYPRVLTEASGVVNEWSWSSAAPTATRALAGLQGEAASRVFHGPLIDAARESEWGDVIETFRDARDIDQPSLAALRLQETLNEGRPLAGLAVSLSETKHFAYDASGIAGVREGDRVRVEVGPGVVVEDVLREATLDWNLIDGLDVEPLIGERSDDPDRALFKTVSALMRGFRNLSGR